MCIICNCGDTGDRFLSEHYAAKLAIEKAKLTMLGCSKVATTPEARKRYDSTHKAMAKLLRDWNRLEELRENGH